MDRPNLARYGLPGDPHKKSISHFQLLLPITQYFFFYFLVAYFIRLSYFQICELLKYFFEQDKIFLTIKVNKTFKDPTRLWKWSRRSRHSSFILQVHQLHGPQTLNMSYQQLIYCTAHGSIRGRREACRGSSISGSSSARPRRRLHPRRNWRW